MVNTAPAFPRRVTRIAVVGRGPSAMSTATPGSLHPAPRTSLAAWSVEGRR